MITKFSQTIITLLLLWLTTSQAVTPAYVSIIIDDLGNNHQYSQQAIKLPGQVTCAFLPYRPFTRKLATEAHQLHKEVMLHAPMEAIRPLPLGQGALTIDMTQDELDQTLLADFKAVPYAQGFNNHMGSLMTQHPGDMNWLMQAVKPLGIYYVDSRTTANSVAEQIARENGIRTTRRNVFLDDKRNTKYIAKQFKKMIHRAKRLGTAVAVAHPHPVTLKFLQITLPKLRNQGIKLIPISQMIAIRDAQQQHIKKVCLHHS